MIRMALQVRISRISLQFLPSFGTEISSLSRDTWVDPHWGWVILQDLTWKNSIRPIFAPGGFGKSSRWNRRNGQGRVCLCMLRHSAKFSLQVGHWRWFEMHGYLERWYTTYLCTYIKEATLHPVAFKQRVWCCTPLEEETTEATSRKSWVQSKIKKAMCMLPQSVAHGKTRHLVVQN